MSTPPLLMELPRLYCALHQVAGGGLLKKQTLRAVDEVTFDLRRGEVLAIVGESGSGKTTLGRLMLRLLQPSAGKILLDGKPLDAIGRRDLSRRIQPIFQDPYSSLNARKTVAQVIALPLQVHGLGTRAERRDKVVEMMARVGLAPRLLHAYPSELSGGQRQRVAIARALVIRLEGDDLR